MKIKNIQTKLTALHPPQEITKPDKAQLVDPGQNGRHDQGSQRPRKMKCKLHGQPSICLNMGVITSADQQYLRLSIDGLQISGS